MNWEAEYLNLVKRLKTLQETVSESKSQHDTRRNEAESLEIWEYNSGAYHAYRNVGVGIKNVLRSYPKETMTRITSVKLRFVIHEHPKGYMPVLLVQTDQMKQPLRVPWDSYKISRELAQVFCHARKPFLKKAYETWYPGIKVTFSDEETS